MQPPVTSAARGPGMRDKNNIGLLRLSLASIVIVGHAIEIASGEAVLFGRWAVTGFFLISGYLITESALTSPPAQYALKRFLRIFPAYCAAYLLSALAIGPLLAPTFDWQFWRIAMLAAPPSVDPNDIHTSLNMSMWTISYEARCYLILGVLAHFGLLHRPKAMLVSASILALASVAMLIPKWDIYRYRAPLLIDLAVGQPRDTIDLCLAFAVGSTVYFYRDRVLPRLSKTTAAAALAAGLIAFRIETIFPVILVLAAAAVLFWIAFRCDFGIVQKINDRFDISYGAYLYGWPIGIALYILIPTISIWQLVLLNLPLAWAAGAFSWFALERPTRYRRLQTRRPNALLTKLR